jgi:hypothetical protein
MPSPKACVCVRQTQDLSIRAHRLTQVQPRGLSLQVMACLATTLSHRPFGRYRLELASAAEGFDCVLSRSTDD